MEEKKRLGRPRKDPDQVKENVCIRILKSDHALIQRHGGEVKWLEELVVPFLRAQEEERLLVGDSEDQEVS